MADLEAVLADVSYLMAMEKSKSTPAARASKKITLPEPRYRPPRRGPGPGAAPAGHNGPAVPPRPPPAPAPASTRAGCAGCAERLCLFATTCAGSLGG